MPIFMLYDSSYDFKTTIDDFISLLWVSKFREIGEFELQVYDTKANRSLFKKKDILRRTDSKQLMFVEKITTRRAVDEPDTLLISGRSCESILSRRVIMDHMTFSGSDIYRIAKKIIDENVISPTNSNRKISNFTMGTTSDTGVTTTLSDPYGEQIDAVITDICEESGGGWRVVHAGTVPSGEFTFYIYKGLDRSDQIIRSVVDDDITELSYGEDITNFKNYFYCDDGAQLIAGSADLIIPMPTGLDRYETKVSVDSKGSSDTAIKRKAKRMVQAENRKGNFIDVVLADPTKGNIQLGEIITVAKSETDYEKVRVIEFMESWDEQGYSKIPTFERGGLI